MQDVALTADPDSLLADAQDQLADAEQMLREAVREQQEEAARRLAGLGTTLQRIVDERVSLRSEIEQRWLRNIRQINGIYEKEDFNKDSDAYGSRIYVPLTRRLRNMAEARLCDMNFPSDGRSFVISPSPIAEMTEAGSTLGDMPPDTPLPGEAGGATVGDLRSAMEDVQKEAESRATKMQRQIDDRLAEGRWPSKARRAIGDAVDLGTGVIKGPVPIKQRTRVWKPDPATGKVTMTIIEKVVSTVEYVDAWNFYPDMSATHINDCVDIAEAHPMSKQELKALRGQPGFNSAAIDMITRSDPVPDNRTSRQELRQLSTVTAAADDKRYCVWEYHGPIEGADINACLCAQEADEAMAVNMDPTAGLPGGEAGGVAPTEKYKDDEEYRGVVWFCNGIVIKAIVQPLDSEQRHVYSVIWWQRDKSSIFGFGLPDETRDQQSSANGSFRAMLDNMGLTVGPQIVFDDNIIKPVDGRYQMSPFKLWKKTEPTADVRQAFAFFQTESRIQELAAVFDKSKALMDEVATAPAFAAGTEQPNYMQSATQASLAYNASTLWVRRFVRHWDDDMIEPLIGRMIDWEMDFNPDESIKGDHHPIAKGIGGLVELEGQGQRMTQFIQMAQQMGVPPRDRMRILRKFASSLKLDPDEVLPTEEEIKQLPADRPDPNAARVEAMNKNSERVHEAKLATLQVKREEIEANSDMYARREKLALLELASRERTTLDQTAQKYGYDLRKLDSEIADNQAQRSHEAQLQNAETALKLRTGSGL